jgi:hypothetical protein
MIAVPNKSDMVLAEIMEFTGTVVSIAQMQGVSNMDKANAIFVAEKILHKVMLNYMSEVADNAMSCSSN